jgi:2-dehydropantoate 2-reductase
MKFVVLGAGAIGTLFAARLAVAGHAVSVVARGARKAQLEKDGLVLKSRRSGAVEVVRVPVHAQLSEAGEADFVLVTVRAQQLDAVMEPLVAWRGDVVTLVNTAAGYGPWSARLGRRLIAGFPGAISSLGDDGVLTWQFAPAVLQPTVVGEPDGTRSSRVDQLAAALRSGGVPVQVRTDMERWIRTHAGWMCPFMLTASGGGDALTEPLVVRRWMEATKEGLRAVRQSGPLVPAVFGLVLVVPLGVLTWVARQVLRSKSIRMHVTAAGAHVAGEGRLLAAELLAASSAASPALTSLSPGGERAGVRGE